MIEITIPVLNEEATLETQVRKVMTFTRDQLREFGPIHLVVADNGSTDQTPVISRRLVDRYPGELRYLRLDAPGVGRALKASWTSSDADVVGYMDLDLATDLTHLGPAFQLVQQAGADVVTGSRLAVGSRVIGRSALRAVTSRSFNMLVRSMFPVRFSDGMCGFKFLRRDKLQQLLELGATSDGWIFATELLIVAERSGLKVKELPVTWTDDPNSKAKIGKLAFEYVSSLRRLKKVLTQKGLLP